MLHQQKSTPVQAQWNICCRATVKFPNFWLPHQTFVIRLPKFSALPHLSVWLPKTRYLSDAGMYFRNNKSADRPSHSLYLTQTRRGVMTTIFIMGVFLPFWILSSLHHYWTAVGALRYYLWGYSGQRSWSFSILAVQQQQIYIYSSGYIIPICWRN